MASRKKQLDLNQLDLFQGFYKKLEIFFNQQTEIVTTSAKDDASSPPEKEVEIKSLPEVNRIKFSCSKMLAEVAKLVKGLLDISLTNFQQADNKIKENQPYNPQIAELNNCKKTENDKLEENFSKRDAALQSTESDLKDDLKNLKLDFQGNVKHALLWPCLIASVIVLLISGSEVFYTAKAFELTGLSFYERFFVAIALGLSTIFVGVGILEIFFTNWKNHWKIIGVVSCALLICGGYFVLGQIRVDLLKKEMASGVEFSNLSAFDFMLINLIFFIAITFVHWMLWPSKDKFRENRKYTKAKNQIVQVESEIKKVQKERINLPNELLKEQEKNSGKYDKSIAEIEKEIAELNTKRAESQTLYNNIYGRLLELYDELNSFYKESVGLYISKLNKYRNDGVFLTIDEPLEDLPNPFEGFKYLEDEQATEHETNEKEYTDINIEF